MYRQLSYAALCNTARVGVDKILCAYTIEKLFQNVAILYITFMEIFLFFSYALVSIALLPILRGGIKFCVHIRSHNKFKSVKNPVTITLLYISFSLL